MEWKESCISNQKLFCISNENQQISFRCHFMGMLIQKKTSTKCIEYDLTFEFVLLISHPFHLTYWASSFVLSVKQNNNSPRTVSFFASNHDYRALIHCQLWQFSFTFIFSTYEFDANHRNSHYSLIFRNENLLFAQLMCNMERMICLSPKISKRFLSCFQFALVHIRQLISVTFRRENKWRVYWSS